MLNVKEYLRYEELWSEAAIKGDEKAEAEYTKKGLSLREQFTKEEWEELIKNTTNGRAKAEYARMMKEKYPN
ncbi:MAG: hypothetical protein J6N93_06225 [Clostridia bacterium]|nr:hypothetical protein [Clostridia bacterium]